MPTSTLWLPRAGAVLVGLVLLGALRPAAAQERVTLSGLAYVDYYYQLTAPDDADEGANGFTFRRLYLTADARLSDAFSARARLEAGESSLGDEGVVPYVKDLYLRWNVGGGHALTFGIAPPPAFEIAEDVWGYRALEKNILDFNDIVDSRDFGLRASGPILPDRSLRYGVMVANNENVFPEDDAHKRVYGQLAFHPTEALVFTLAGTYATYEGPRDRQYVAAILAGYVTDTWRAGLEGFLNTDTFDGLDDRTSVGVSLHGSVAVTDAVSVVGRVDRVRREEVVDLADAPRAVTRYATLGLVGVDVRPDPSVHLIPNVEVLATDGAGEALTLARLTVWFEF